MDFMLFVFAVDLVLCALVGYLVARFAKRYLPEPFQDARIVILTFVLVGTLVTMVTFPHWAIYPD